MKNKFNIHSGRKVRIHLGQISHHKSLAIPYIMIMLMKEMNISMMQLGPLIKISVKSTDLTGTGRCDQPEG